MRLARRLGLAALAVALGAGVAAGNAADDDVEADPQPWLGISFSRQNNFSNGVPIESVFEDTAASASGLRSGDELISIDGEPVNTNTLPLHVGAAGIGATLTLQVLRHEATGRDDDSGYRIVTLRATLTARPSDRELLRRQLVGKRAPPFTLVASDEPEAASIDDSALNDKVGVLVWFTSACEGCLGVIDRLATWAATQPKDIVVIAGTREEPVSLAAYLKSNAIMVPVGSDVDAWRTYAAVDDAYTVAIVAVVGRDGVVRLALPARAAGDAAIDEVIATAERLVERRKPRR
jgi:hypothetical protein